MGEIVELRPGDGVSSNYRLPEWPQPRQVTISIEQMRAIDRDVRHLDEVIQRVRDVRTISTIVSTICGADRAEVERAAQTISMWLRTGRQ